MKMAVIFITSKDYSTWGYISDNIQPTAIDTVYFSIFTGY